MALPLHVNKRVIAVTAVLIALLAIGLVANTKPRSVRNDEPIRIVNAANKDETSMMDVRIKDFPERGISLIGPSSPSFAKMAAQVVKTDEGLVSELFPYSVFLQNTSNRAVVGYRITWECVDKKGETTLQDVSNILSHIFLHGSEVERNKAMAGDARVMRPNSTWFISLDRPEERVEGTRPGKMEESILTSQIQLISKEFSKVTISVDGLFFEDGTFLGADAFFTEVESLMDARRELLSEVESAHRSGATAEDILSKLERIANQEMPEFSESPSRSEYMNSFRILFAKDIVGMKTVFGSDKAIEDAREQLSKPWVQLRRL